MWRRVSVRVLLLALLLLAVGVPAMAVVVQQGSLRVTVSAQLKPYKLPRSGTAPIDVFIAGHIASTDGTTPPQLRRMEVLLNRHGVIDAVGLPRCRLHQIASATNEQALQRCAPALVGSGHFWASIVLPSQPSYHTTGRLLVFNGVRADRPYLFAHIYTAVPFPSSFVVSFSIRHVHRGSYSTELTASLPQALGDWGYVNRIKMTLGRTYHHGGRDRGYVEAGCPALKGAPVATFPLALATLVFADHRQIHALVNRSCGVRE